MRKIDGADSGTEDHYLFTQPYTTGLLRIPKGCKATLEYPEVEDRKSLTQNSRFLNYVDCRDTPNLTAKFGNFEFTNAIFSEKQCLLRETNSEPPITKCGRSYVANTPIFFAFGKLDCRRTILVNTVGGKTNPYEGR